MSVLSLQSGTEAIGIDTCVQMIEKKMFTERHDSDNVCGIHLGSLNQGLKPKLIL